MSTQVNPRRAHEIPGTWHQKVELVPFRESLVQKKRKEGKIKLEFR